MLVNSKSTSNSDEHERVMKIKGLDRHTASAYLIALSEINNNQHKPI